MRWALVLLIACSDPRAPVAEAPALNDCEPAGPYAFYPTTTPPPEDRVRIQSAMSKWNAVTREDRLLFFSRAGHQRIMWMQPPEPLFTGQWLADGVMFIRPERADTHGIALHEFGHVLGLAHLPIPGAVMCGGDGVRCPQPGPTDLTAADLDECRRVGACP